jgi:hypothetical protein
VAWGLETGLISQNGLWHYSWYDSEMGDTMSFTFSTVEEALAEAGCESLDHAKAQSIDVAFKSDGILPTEKLNEYVGSKVDPAFAFDMLCCAHAETVMQIDGVWWNELLDSSIYSAPRGMIFTSVLATWNKKQVAPISTYE